MNIAFTADCHLTSLTKNPERFSALANIFQQCGEKDVQLLVIAGDLFDDDQPNFAEFEKIFHSSRPPDLKTVLIPGNHDQRLNQGALIGKNLLVYSDPTLQPLNDSRKILFLPYTSNQGMGEIIAAFSEDLIGQRWILVSHGDWTASRNTHDPYEKGLYMPLTRTDLDLYQPEMVILGHIHLAQQDHNIFYPGSPCPLNISETGLRSFLILDTDGGEIKTHIVDSPLIYYDENFVMLPTENGLDLLLADIKARIKAWQVPGGWEDRTQIRIGISGSTSIAREAILQEVKSAFQGFPFYKGIEPDLSSLAYDTDPDKIELTSQIKKWVDELDWAPQSGSPSKDQVLEQALKVIHGG